MSLFLQFLQLPPVDVVCHSYRLDPTTRPLSLPVLSCWAFSFNQSNPCAHVDSSSCCFNYLKRLHNHSCIRWISCFPNEQQNASAVIVIMFALLCQVQ